MARKALGEQPIADLPVLPEGWTYEPLSALVDADRGICYGIVQPGSHEDSGVPIVRVNNIRDAVLSVGDAMRVSADIERKYERSRLRGGEVLLSLVGSLGETAIVPPEMIGWNVARAVGVIPVKPSIGPRWIHLCLRSPLMQHYIRMWATTTVQATFNLGDLARLPIPLPPLPEQRAIAGVLGALDDKIEVNRKTARVLEGIARAVFTSWFVDFDPVRRRAASHPGSAAPLPADLAALFPTRLVDSPIGEVPEGWRVGTLGDIADVARDGVDPGEIDAATPYIGLEHMPRRCIALDQWEHAGKVSSGKSRFRRGQILFGKLRPYFHKVGVAPVDGVCSTDIIVAEPKKPYWMALALGHLSSDALVNHADGSSTGTKMPRTNWRDLAAFEIAIPPEPIAARASALVVPIVQRMEAGIQANRTLAALRDALLPKLISGELRIADAEKIVGRAV